MNFKEEKDEGVVFMNALTATERQDMERARARRRDVEARIAAALWTCLDNEAEARENLPLALDESGAPAIPGAVRLTMAPLSLGDLQEREVMLLYMGPEEGR